ncbi:pfs domain-containing protein [Colletotrichum abscissum]|uniref:Pfs domain-containing protein n=1 Tax=Colletotrichum abscissum TaxID=1671311 RepID=A0A9Q0AZE5_9PEZI|nr:pfs domain-containing protein [Colletotrichum abscissum]
MTTLAEPTVGYICANVETLTSCTVSLDEELDEEQPSLPQTRYDDNVYTFGKIGSRSVAMCCVSFENQSVSGVVVDMMRSFPSIKLLVLVNNNAGAAPRDAGRVRVGDVVVAHQFVATNRDGDVIEQDLIQGSGLLATTNMKSCQRWSLDDDVAALASRNNQWGEKCRRPAKDDTDALDKIFVPRRQDESASVIHLHGLVISNPTYPEHAESRDSVANLGTFESASIICFDHGQTAGLPMNKQADVDGVSVLGVSNYCDEDTEGTRKIWTRYTSLAAAACARKIVMQLADETTPGGTAKARGKEDD